MIKKIISGGLPGVELAALYAAIKLGIPHGGWTYKSRKTKNDALREKFNLKEIANPSYFERLEKNIIDSEGTVILTYGQLIRGAIATKNLADKYNKPCLLLRMYLWSSSFFYSKMDGQKCDRKNLFHRIDPDRFAQPSSGGH
jgi:hypothetical protein